jgi:4a-hydroxytetrahydrobiopterin dehydratase
MLAAVPGWELDELCTRLRRTFRFTSFALAQAFAVRVGEIVEAENHHPDICYGWGYCAITLYTHKIGGLHDNDFIIAAKVNSLNAAA